MSLRRLLLVLPFAALVGCNAPSASITPRVIELGLSGDLAATTGGNSGSSSIEALGLDQDLRRFNPRADLVVGPMRLTAEGFQGEYRGQGTLEADFVLDGITLTAGSDVASRLDLGFLRAVSTFDLPIPGPVDVGLGLGVTLFDVDLELESELSRVTSDELVPVPYLAGRVGADFGRVGAELLVGYLEISAGDVRAKYLDADALLRVRLFGQGVRGYLVGGYRWILLDLAYDDGDERVSVDVRLTGPFLGLTIAF